MHDVLVVEVNAGQPDAQVGEVAHVNEGGLPGNAGEGTGAIACGKNEATGSLNGADGRSEPGPNSGRANAIGARDGGKSFSTDELDKHLHGGLQEYLQLFFGTTELAKDEDAIRPNAAGWTQCPFDRTCTLLGSSPIPKGDSGDQQEAELGLLYAILYFVLVHLMSVHSGARLFIRTVRYRISDICVQRNKRLMMLRRMQAKEKEKPESKNESSESSAN